MTSCKQGFNCGEVGSAYFDMNDILCGNMLESISNLVTHGFWLHAAESSRPTWV